MFLEILFAGAIAADVCESSIYDCYDEIDEMRNEIEDLKEELEELRFERQLLSDDIDDFD
ncbi:hypothetical protein IKE67_03055 [bacterium]|nr:hypothetical protein [bacterium]